MNSGIDMEIRLKLNLLIIKNKLKMKLDFTTVTQERQDELQEATIALFQSFEENIQSQSMQTINVSIAEFCNTPEELAMCCIIAGVTLNEFGIV